MIKINRNRAFLNSLTKKHYKFLLNPPYSIGIKLKDLMLKIQPTHKNDGLVELKSLLEKIELNLENIITGTPEKLEEFISNHHQIYKDFRHNNLIEYPKQKGVTSEFDLWRQKIERVFNYNKFCNQYTGKWGAYPLVKELGIAVCPYCNRNYINTFLSNDKKTRARLDHWFDKGSYPYLALSFYNLIPSCHTCNSDMKSSEPFTLKTHIHPYIEGFEEKMVFATEVLSAEYVEGKKNSFSIMIKTAKPSSQNDPQVEKARANIASFGIEELYSFHEDLASDLLSKSYVYNESKIDELLKISVDGNPLFKNREEVLQFVLGNFLKKEDFEKRPFSKLTYDIAKEQGLITNRT